MASEPVAPRAPGGGRPSWFTDAQRELRTAQRLREWGRGKAVVGIVTRRTDSAHAPVAPTSPPLAPHSTRHLEDVPDAPPCSRANGLRDLTLLSAVRRHIREVLEYTGGHLAWAAQEMAIHPATLWRMLKKWRTSEPIR